MYRIITSTLAALLILSFTAAVEARSSIKINNKSSWDIHRLYLSPVGDREWGPDQLGRHIIGSGETFTLTNVRCNDYDVQIIDEDGDVCIFEDVYLCGREDWRIDDKYLLSCQALTDY